MTPVTITDHAKVRTLTFNRPESLNAFNEAMCDAVTVALLDAAADPEVSVVLITGAGRAFSAGVDLNEFTVRATDPDSFTPGEYGFSGLIDALIDFPKPLICAVNGVGVGIGTTILGFADLAFMSSTARLKCPFSSLGVPPEASSSYLLPTLIGRQNAAWVLIWCTLPRRVSPGIVGERHVAVMSATTGTRSPRRPIRAMTGRDEFGDLNAVSPVDADDFALRDQRAVGIDVEQLVCGAVEFDDAAVGKREQFGERHRGRSDLDRDAQRDAREQVEIGRAGDRPAAASRVANRCRPSPVSSGLTATTAPARLRARERRPGAPSPTPGIRSARVLNTADGGALGRAAGGVDGAEFPSGAWVSGFF